MTSKLCCILVFSLLSVTGCGGGSEKKSTSNDLTSDIPLASKNLRACAMPTVDNNTYANQNGGVLYSDFHYLRYFDLETQQTTELISESAGVGQRVPSSTGKYVAYSEKATLNDLNIINIQTGEHMQVAQDLLLAAFKWSFNDEYFTAITENHIVKVNTLSGERTHLFELTNPIDVIRWSPNGKSILFMTDESFEIVDENGERIDTIIPTEDNKLSLWDLSFSPNGNYFIYEENNGDLYLYDIAKKQTRLIHVADRHYSSDPRWSATSEYIAVPSHLNDWALFIYNVATEQLEPIAGNEDGYTYMLYDFSWSNTGNRLAFAMEHSEKKDEKVMLLDLDASSQPVKITIDIENLGGFKDLQWSPNGEYLAVIANFNGYNESLHVVDVTRNCFADLTPAMGDGDRLMPAYNMQWSNSGKYLIYPHYRSTTGESINLISIDGTTQVELTPLLSTPERPAITDANWHPTSDALYFTTRDAWTNLDRVSIDVFEIESLTKTSIAREGGSWFGDYNTYKIIKEPN